MLTPLEKLSRKALEARERWHLELARVYDQHSEQGMAAKFLECAAVYRKELDIRPLEPETPQQAQARERREAAAAAIARGSI